jgi:hypothetical protein
MASAAASSQEEELDPITSITRYTLMTTSHSLSVGSFNGGRSFWICPWLSNPAEAEKLERTRPAWEARDLDGFLAGGQHPVVAEDSHRHQLVANELLRRPCNR